MINLNKPSEQAIQQYSETLRTPSSFSTILDFALWSTWELNTRARDDKGQCAYCSCLPTLSHAEDCPLTFGFQLRPPQPARQRYTYQLSCEVCGAEFTAKSRLRTRCDLHRRELHKERQRDGNRRAAERRREAKKRNPK